jgi:pectate lyase
MSIRIFAVTLVTVAVTHAAGIPAFPGAEGFGSTTPGGRGGKVILVTNLNDSGPGSFRAACEAKGPRIVVFRVGGIIDLNKSIRITEPFLTIAGQTAPGDGICLRRYNFGIETHDVVVRFIRSRLGPESGKEMDSISIGGDSRNVILDHCSASWSVDEVLSPSGAVADVTVQWCIIAEGLNKSVHHKGAHGYGSLVRAVGGLTMHHNLWAHNIARNPRLGDNYGKPPFPVFDIRNNVMYDYVTCSGMTGDILSANYVANYIRPGPSSKSTKGPIVLTKTANVKYYIKGNVVEASPEMTADNSKMFDPVEAEGRKLITLVPKPFDAPKVTTSPAREAYKMVLERVGATAPLRDAVDRRLVSEVTNRTGSVINSPQQVGGWPAYRNGTPPQDTDNDGIPDDWEKAHGLNPKDPSDASRQGPDGYTNIEKYLNGIAPTPD